MSNVIVIGRSISSEALRAAYDLAASSKTGSIYTIESEDLKGAKIIINGEVSSFVFSTVQKYANYGVKGRTVTRDEFARRLQEIADRTGNNVVIIFRSRKKITIKPLVQHKAVSEFEKLAIAITAPPPSEVPYRIDLHIRNNYSYTNNTTYQNPAETYEKRSGDCNDFAIFSHFLLSRAGYSPRLFLLYRPQNTPVNMLPITHDICVYQDKNTGLYNYFDQTGLRETEAPTLEGLFDSAAPGWDKAREREVIKGIVYSDTGHERYIYRK
jgi:hypothetical protein